MQTLDIHGKSDSEGPSLQEKHLQHWIPTLLLGSSKLASLSIVADCVPWTPVLGLLSIRHLQLTVDQIMPWTDIVMADLSFCSFLETLKITESMEEGMMWCIEDWLPDLFLRDVVTPKSMELIGRYPKVNLTLPPGCLLRVAVIVMASAQWNHWQKMGFSTSVLHLKCLQLRPGAWPIGIQGMSDLRYLSLSCDGRMQNQDLAALQHIPHVNLRFNEDSTFLLTSRFWESLQISGEAGFDVGFSNVDAFVRDTRQFLFECTSQEVGGMYAALHAACMRQGVACYKCVHAEGYYKQVRVAQFSNMKVCRTPSGVQGATPNVDHRCLLDVDGCWPSRAASPELYR